MAATALLGPDFRRVLCPAGLGPGHREAVHRAISLCADGASLRFLATVGRRHDDLAPPGEPTEMQARGALELALAAVGAAPIDATVSLRRDRPAAEALIDEARDHDLLVLSSHTWSDRRHAAVDASTLRVAMLAPCPVLLTHPSPPGGERSLRVRLVAKTPRREDLAERIRRTVDDDPLPVLVRPSPPPRLRRHHVDREDRAPAPIRMRDVVLDAAAEAPAITGSRLARTR